MPQDSNNIQEDRIQILKLGKIIAILVIAFLALAIVTKAKGLSYIGSGASATNMITVAGTGDVEKAPDTAKFSFTVTDEQKDVKSAQATVSDKVTKVKNDLIAAGVDASDITTSSYDSYPQYDYPTVQPCAPGTLCSQTSSKPTLRGYQVSQSVNVSVKNLDIVETVVGILGTDAVTNIDGPNFGFADDHEVQNEARDKAIADAKNQAQILAKSLGVHLVRIVSFTEDNTGNGVVPMYAKALDSVGSAAPAAPTLPTGSQKVTSNVTVVYEIR